MLEIKALPTGKWKENCYVVFDDNRTSIVIDPGEDAEVILAFLKEEKLDVQAIINTHAHYDHVGAVAEIKQAFGAKFYLHQGDFKLLKQANFYRMIFEGERTVQIAEVDEDLSKYERIQVGEMDVQIIPTAGHTAGGVSLFIGDALFTGDNIMGRKMGRADLPGGNAALLKESVEKLLQLPEHITIYPGHGKPVTIAEVKQHMQKLAGVA